MVAFWQNVSQSVGAFFGRDGKDSGVAKNSQFKPLGYPVCHKVKLTGLDVEFKFLGKAYMNGALL